MLATTEKVVDVVVGSAGSGKTHFLCEELTRLKRSMHLAPEQIAMCTFTRTGRGEISERLAEQWGCTTERLTKDAGNFRTAHSFAYRGCGIESGQVLSEDKESRDWLDDLLGGYHCAKECLEVWSAARNMGISLHEANRRVLLAKGTSPDEGLMLEIVKKYERAKKMEDRLDFHDVIARFAGVRFHPDGGYEEVLPMGEVPNVAVIAVDEAQDSSFLVDRVCRRLAEPDHVKHVLLCGDPFQSIHAFAGGDYRLFLRWSDDRKIMPKSYRCPAAIHRYGEERLMKMHSGYFDRQVEPASHSGDILRVSTFAEAMTNRVGEDCLVLARCQYMVENYIQDLTARDVPHSRVDRTGSDKADSAHEALYRLEKGRPVKAEDWRNAVEALATRIGDETCLERGCKTAWVNKGRYNDLSTKDLIGPTDEYMKRAGCTETLIAAVRAGRWPEMLMANKRDRAARWRRVASIHGVEIANAPPTRLSTIHAAKGCEADTVIVSARSTSVITRGCEADASFHDEECRVAYVAATRAKRRLILLEDLQSSSRNRMPL